MFSKKPEEVITPSKLFHLKKFLSHEYVEPFLKAIPKNLSHRQALTTTIKALQDQANAIIFFQRFPAQYEEPSHEANVSKALFGRSLNENIELKKAYENLAFIYCYKDVQEKKFPNESCARIQTCIREIFHDVLRPLETLTKENIQALSHDEINNQILVPTGFLNLPLELMEIVHSFLDDKSCESFSFTCKAAHFFHQNIINRPNNIFYVLGNEVAISKRRTLEESLTDMSRLFLPKIENDVLIHSRPSKNLKMIKLFPSLYQAIEYAHHLSYDHGIKSDAGDICHIPSLWAVRYKGNTANLSYLSKDVVLNRRMLDITNYAKSERNLTIDYANGDGESFQFLMGTVIYSDEFFASYTEFNTVTCQSNRQNNLSPNTP